MIQLPPDVRALIQAAYEVPEEDVRWMALSDRLEETPGLLDEMKNEWAIMWPAYSDGENLERLQSCLWANRETCGNKYPEFAQQRNAYLGWDDITIPISGQI